MQRTTTLKTANITEKNTIKEICQAIADDFFNGDYDQAYEAASEHGNRSYKKTFGTLINVLTMAHHKALEAKESITKVSTSKLVKVPATPAPELKADIIDHTGSILYGIQKTIERVIELVLAGHRSMSEIKALTPIKRTSGNVSKRKGFVLEIARIDGLQASRLRYLKAFL